jgi:hypothetical protein
MEINQKMIADLLILIGALCIFIGWQMGGASGGIMVIRIVLFGIGIIVGWLGLSRYFRSSKK